MAVELVPYPGYSVRNNEKLPAIKDNSWDFFSHNYKHVVRTFGIYLLFAVTCTVP